jgi:hypothetical protein
VGCRALRGPGGAPRPVGLPEPSPLGAGDRPRAGAGRRVLAAKPVLKRAGIRMRGLYQTRHTFATLALSSGEAIGWVAEMLGHANTEMVIRHYHKFIPNLTRQDGSAFASHRSGGPPLIERAGASRCRLLTN